MHQRLLLGMLLVWVTGCQPLGILDPTKNTYSSDLKEGYLGGNLSSSSECSAVYVSNQVDLRTRDNKKVMHVLYLDLTVTSKDSTGFISNHNIYHSEVKFEGTERIAIALGQAKDKNGVFTANYSMSIVTSGMYDQYDSPTLYGSLLTGSLSIGGNPSLKCNTIYSLIFIKSSGPTRPGTNSNLLADVSSYEFANREQYLEVSRHLNDQLLVLKHPVLTAKVTKKIIQNQALLESDVTEITQSTGLERRFVEWLADRYRLGLELK